MCRDPSLLVTHSLTPLDNKGKGPQTHRRTPLDCSVCAWWNVPPDYCSMLPAVALREEWEQLSAAGVQDEESRAEEDSHS